jgi:HEAT repeat protein
MKRIVMDKTLQNLLTLAREGSIEQRSAALLVVGALKLDDDPVLDAVRIALENGNIILTDYALRYCEEVRPKACISWLLRLLQDNEKETAERAVRLLSSLGQSVVRPLVQQAKTMNRTWHLRAAQVLSAVRGKAAWQGLLQLLLVGDTEVNKTICDLVATTLRDLDEKEQEVLSGEIDALTTGLNPQEQRTATISAIRLLGTLGRPQARKWLMGFVGGEQHHSVRFHALVALLHCLRGQDLHKAEFARLLPVLEEKELSDTVRLTLDLFEAHELPEEYQPVLARLLESPHVAVQKFALRKMGEFDSPVVVRTLVQQLDDQDTARRDAAARSLRKIPAARTVLTQEFLACEEPSKAWVIAEILPVYEGKWRRDTLDEVWKRLETALAAEERIAGAYLHFLKQVALEYAYAQFAARGDKLKKAKKYKEAVRFLSPLKEFPTWTAEDKFALAVAQLKLHAHDVVSAPSRHDPALDLFTDLYRSSAFPVFETLKKEKGLEPEDLFYLGFRFVEGTSEVRSLGEDVLEFLADKYPRAKVGKNAKNKLKLLAS